jgi:hypothetical protein
MRRTGEPAPYLIRQAELTKGSKLVKKSDGIWELILPKELEYDSNQFPDIEWLDGDFGDY